MPLNPPNLLSGLDYLEPVATHPVLNMGGSSADEQANPTFSMNSLDILQFSQSHDSLSGTSGPASVASTSKSTVKNSRRMRVGKLKTARYALSQTYLYMTEACGFYSRNLCAADWKQGNPQGTTDEFVVYYQNISTEEKLVCNAQRLNPIFLKLFQLQRYKRLEFEHKTMVLTGS